MWYGVFSDQKRREVSGDCLFRSGTTFLVHECVTRSYSTMGLLRGKTALPPTLFKIVKQL